MTRSRDTASIIPTVDAKGDLLVGTADNTIDNLSPGTNGQVLTANSTTATGLEWATKPPFAMAAGQGSIPAPTALNTASSLSVTFPASRFTFAPMTVATIDSTAANGRFVKVESVTTTGFTVSQYQIAGGTLQATGYYYVAIQMLSGSSAG